MIKICVINFLFVFSVWGQLPTEKEFIFEADSGEKVTAFRGVFQVPENRKFPNGKKIPIVYVRFPATGKKEGSPIVYLSGGPGGSGIATAKWKRFKMFMALREFADVIALDQRGTGESDVTSKCVSSQVIPNDVPVSESGYAEFYRDAFRECKAFWKNKGIDLGGYNTLESVADLESLRQHLRADKISLWGISYGSHLALAAIKKMEDRLDKVIIASVEGLDQTVKMPKRTDDYFTRLQSAINTNPVARNLFPDVKKLIRRVHENLEKKPILLNIDMKSGESGNYLLQKRDMQILASRMVADPHYAFTLLTLYNSLDSGNVKPINELIRQFYGVNEPIMLRAMPIAMDVASGTGKRRAKKIRKQAEKALLGTYLNYTSFHLEDIASELDLGNAFREKVVSQVPTLVFSGTLDGRTYIESQHEAVQGLEQATLITVKNAGHNLFMSSPKVLQVMSQFFNEKPIKDKEIIVPLPFAVFMQ